MRRQFFIVFVEEAIMGADFNGCVGGRIKTYDSNNRCSLSVDELLFLTEKREQFHEFKERWDLKHITGKELETIKHFLRLKFQEKL